MNYKSIRSRISSHCVTSGPLAGSNQAARSGLAGNGPPIAAPFVPIADRRSETTLKLGLYMEKSPDRASLPGTVTSEDLPNECVDVTSQAPNESDRGYG